MRCRHCRAELELVFADLGSAPPSNSYLTEAQLRAPERWFPLRVLVCKSCWLVQTEDFAHFTEMFSEDYAYFSSYSSSWLAHANRYVDAMVQRLRLDATSMVVELAANDGYLLQYVRGRGIPCLGVEPTHSTAIAARARGIEVCEEFFGISLARRLVGEGRQADLIVANNVLAHVPDINDFVGGAALLLKSNGLATFEFPHLLRLVADCQFDTIYHEHFSYLSLTAVVTIFERNGLAVVDVEELPTHGGSLRVFAQRREAAAGRRSNAVDSLLGRESEVGVKTSAYYAAFQPRAEALKDGFVEFLLQTKRAGKRVGAYGAAAKGNTLLNFAGVKVDLLPWVVDRSPSKIGKYLPGSRIPILSEEAILSQRPDHVLVLPWNLRAEIAVQLEYVRAWGATLAVAVPAMHLL